MNDFASTPEGLKLVQSFVRIEDADVRRLIVGLVQAIASKNGGGRCVIRPGGILNVPSILMKQGSWRRSGVPLAGLEERTTFIFCELLPRAKIHAPQQRQDLKPTPKRPDGSATGKKARAPQSTT
jgi:hypothetical protein